MTLAAGSKLRASELIAAIPQRVGTTTRTSNTSTYTTTEVVTDTVTASLVSGRTYKVTSFQALASSVAADTITMRIREDSLTGTQLQAMRFTITATGTTWLAVLVADYVAVATGSKSFVNTSVRATGTGNCSNNASATAPNFLIVEQVVSGL